MKIYLSSLTMPVIQDLEERIPGAKPNVLISYGVPKNDDLLIMQSKGDLIDSSILDSGTFTDFFADENSMNKITFDGYLDYLRVCADKFDFYFNFDKNFTTEGFEENLYYLNQLEDKGYKPVPVIHDYYNEEIEYYIEEGYKLIALGSVVDARSKKFLRNQFDINQAVERLIKHDIKVHLFAAASYNQLAYIPLYSSDASSWAQYSAAGRILFWNEHNEDNKDDDKTEIIRMDDRPDLTPDGNFFFDKYPWKKELKEHLDSMSYCYDDLMGFEYNHNRQVVNAAYYLQLENIITKKHQEQGFPF